MTGSDTGDTQTMRWTTAGTGYLCAMEIVAWIQRQGGSARYEPGTLNEIKAGMPPYILIESPGDPRYAAPGDTIERTDEWFREEITVLNARRLRVFTVSRPGTEQQR